MAKAIVYVGKLKLKSKKAWRKSLFLNSGRPLTKVENFKCRSQNLEKMVCSFTGPFNHIPVSYNLTFKTNNFSGLRKNCALSRINDREWSCTVYSDNPRDRADNPDLDTSILFELSKNFTFRLVSYFDESTNAPLNAQELQETFVIDHYGSLIPAVPSNMTISELKPTLQS